MTPAEFWVIILIGTLLAGILSGAPVMLVLAGVPMLVALPAWAASHFDLAFIQAYPQRIFGIMENGLLVAVPLFVLMGVLLERSKIAERMLLVATAAFRGAPAAMLFAVIMVSTLIAASTGIIGATIVMMGMIALPAMLRSGVPPRLASGVICASGTLGQIIPPSIVLVLLGDQIANAYLEGQRSAGNWAPDPVTVVDLFAGAMIPGLLLVLTYLIFAWFRARTLPAAPIGRAVEESDKGPVPPGALELIMSLAGPLGLIAAVLGSILLGIATPTEAAAIGAAGTVLLAADREARPGVLGWLVRGGMIGAVILIIAAFTALPGLVGLGLFLFGLASALLVLARRGTLASAAHETASITAMIFAIILAASLLSVVFRGMGGDEVVEALLADIPGGEAGAILAVMVLIFFLGFILEFVEIIFIVVPTIGPVLLAGNVDPVWFAVLIALNLQTSFLTPPFGFALFYFRGVAPPSITTLEIYRAILPFVCLQIVVILMVAAWPPLATWLPSILFD